MGLRRVGGVEPLTGARYAKNTEGHQNGSFVLASGIQITISCGLADTTLHLPLLHDPHNLFRWLLVGKQHIHLTDIA